MVINRYYYAFSFLIGFGILVVEILGGKMVTPYFGNTVYVWSSMIGTTIIALAAGYYAGGMISTKHSGVKSYAIIMCLVQASTILFMVSYDAVFTASMGLGVFGSFVASLLFFPILCTLGMFTPLNVQNTSSSVSAGKSSGRIFAVGTVGSFAGAIISGFVLIPLFPLSLSLSVVTVFMAIPILVAYVHSKSDIRVMIISSILIVCVIMTNGIGTAYADDRIVFEKNSFYGNVKVVDMGERTRILFVDNAMQSSADKIDMSTMSFMKRMTDFVFYDRDIDNVLILGMGSGGLSKHIGDRADVLNVEIDPLIVDVAKEYFDYDGNYVIDDARHYVLTTDTHYDLLVYDIATGDSFPSHLFTDEMFSHANRILGDGVLIMNMDGADDSEKIRAISSTLKNNFDYVMVIKIGEDITNGRVFFASDSPFNIEDGITHSSLSDGEKSALLNTLNNQIVIGDGLVLTDDYNPLDIWQTESALAWRQYTLEEYGFLYE